MLKCSRFIFSLLFLALLALPVKSKEGVWLLVDTEMLTLTVKRNKETVDIFKNIAIGRNGAGFKKRKGDNITPKGVYKIGWINHKSPFYRFYGFNYPSVDNANEALLWGLLNKSSHTAIVNAHKSDKVPPQNTAIGGRIGIHGLGNANKAIHQMMNWTHGCIALTNDQINRLDKWMGKGTLVKVK